MATQSSTKTTRRNATTRQVPQFVSKFREWLTVRDLAAQAGEQQTELRGDLKDQTGLVSIIKSQGVKDDEGHYWLDLPEPVEFEDHPVGTKPGKVHVYTTLKLERHLTPSKRTPDHKKAEVLLKKKKLWLTKAQLETLAAIQDACPAVTISFDLDPEYVAKLVFADRITDDEYESVLVEQKESYQFRPSEG